MTLNEGSVLKLNEATARLAVPLDLTVNGSGKIQMYSASRDFGNGHAGAVIAHRLCVNGVEQAKEKIYEFPLFQWHDIDGSQLKSRDFFKAPAELWKIYRKYS